MVSILRTSMNSPTSTRIRKFLTPLLEKRKVTLRKIKEEKQNLASAKNKLACALDAASVVQEVAALVQNEAHKKIASVVTKCLDLVFDDPYTFKIRFDKKRGKTEARLVFERNGKEYDPTSSSGGGVIGVAAFALRLAALVLGKPSCRRLLVLDEPFAALSSEYRPNVAKMLEAVSKDLGVQIIQVTHSQELEVGKVIRIGE